MRTPLCASRPLPVGVGVGVGLRTCAQDCACVPPCLLPVGFGAGVYFLDGGEFAALYLICTVVTWNPGVTGGGI